MILKTWIFATNRCSEGIVLLSVGHGVWIFSLCNITSIWFYHTTLNNDGGILPLTWRYNQCSEQAGILSFEYIHRIVEVQIFSSRIIAWNITKVSIFSCYYRCTMPRIIIVFIKICQIESGVRTSRIRSTVSCLVRIIPKVCTVPSLSTGLCIPFCKDHLFRSCRRIFKYFLIVTSSLFRVGWIRFVQWIGTIIHQSFGCLDTGFVIPIGIIRCHTAYIPFVYCLSRKWIFIPIFSYGCSMQSCSWFIGISRPYCCPTLIIRPWLRKIFDSFIK